MAEKKLKSMKWDNLQDGKCPKPECQGDLMEDKNANVMLCKAPHCRFQVAMEKFRNITSSIATGSRRGASSVPVEENREGLNSL